MASNSGAEGIEAADVGGHRIIGEVPAQDIRQPRALHGDRQVLALPDFAFDREQLGPLSFGDGVTHEDEPSLFPWAVAANVGEAQEPEGFGLALAAALPPFGRKATEADEPGFVGMELELELLQPLFHLRQEPFGVLLALKAEDDIIGIAHQDDFSATRPLSLPLHPQVEHIVQVHVGEQRRDNRPLRSAFRAGFPLIVVHDSSLQPFGDQAQEPLVSYPVLEHFHQPRVIDGIEIRANVGVEHPVHFPAAEGHGQRVERLMRRPTGPEPVGKAEEVLFIDGIEHPDNRALDDFVFQRRDAERSLPSVGFGYINPLRGLGPVSPTVELVAQLLQPCFQPHLVLLPTHAVHSRRRPSLQPLEGGSQPGDIQEMEQTGEPCFLV